MASRVIAFTGDARSVHLTDTDFSIGGIRDYYFEDQGPHEDPVVRTVRDEFLAKLPATISGATAANPVVITATAHGFENGYKVTIAGVVGMVELNTPTEYVVANKAADTFELTGIDGSAFTAYTSGGIATLRAISGNATISLP